MTPTQQERRIQALYDDSNVSRRNLCERVVHLEADMEDVKALCRDELADCITACCNLAARYDLDMDRAMERCEKRNRARGRYA